MTKDAAQRSPSALLRAVSMSNGSWTFYEAIKNGWQQFFNIRSRRFEQQAVKKELAARDWQ